MRAMALLCVGPALAGCGIFADRPPPAPTRPLASRECAAVARQRMEDAAAIGYEPDMQRAIFNGAYAACVAGDEHPSPP